MNQDTIHLLLEAFIGAALTFAGFIGTRIVKRLEMLDEHEIKLQVHDVKHAEAERRLAVLEVRR